MHNFKVSNEVYKKTSRLIPGLFQANSQWKKKNIFIDKNLQWDNVKRDNLWKDIEINSK